jgi:hypothetical protein
VSGEERCEHCGQTYAYELERRCVACDAPLCPFCVTTVHAEVHCPECCERENGE